MSDNANKSNHETILRNGAEAWNRHRRETGESPHVVETDLAGIDLAGADLNGGVFLNSNLQKTNLQKANLSNAHIVESNLTKANLSGANLENTICIKSIFLSSDLRHANLRGTILHEACLTGADLTDAKCSEKTDFGGAELMESKLPGVDLSGASLLFADLRKADLRGAILKHSDACETVFTGADMSGADLSDTNLSRATLVRAKVQNTIFTGARIYGISVWDLDGEPADESMLRITPIDEPEITVGDLEVAQFVYLLLNNKKIRDVIDTVTAKTVLILGRFTEDHKKILDSIRDQLTTENYVPIIFDFDKPAKRDLTETVRTLAHLARFIIADITDPKSIPQELTTIIPQLPSVPVQPILLKGKREWAMLKDLKRTGQVLKTFVYDDLADVVGNLRKRIINPPEAWLEQFSNSSNPLAALQVKQQEFEDERRKNERLIEELNRLKAAMGE